jgi:hypothetical protein
MHCPYKNLADLKDCLAAIRQWPGIVEPKPGFFYLGRTAFLHFHLQDGVRTADVRAGKDWGAVLEIPIDTSAQRQKRFLTELKRRYKVTAAVFASASKPSRSSPRSR